MKNLNPCNDNIECKINKKTISIIEWINLLKKSLLSLSSNIDNNLNIDNNNNDDLKLFYSLFNKKKSSLLELENIVNEIKNDIIWKKLNDNDHKKLINININNIDNY